MTTMIVMYSILLILASLYITGLILVKHDEKNPS
jgi:hypothetical protein